VEGGLADFAPETRVSTTALMHSVHAHERRGGRGRSYKAKFVRIAMINNKRVQSAAVATFASCVAIFANAAEAPTKLMCDADTKDNVSRMLELTEKDGQIGAFSYISSIPTPGLATNCMIDSGEARGAPMVVGNSTTFKLEGDDVVVVRKSSKGWTLDMSKLNSQHYCAGIVAVQVTLKTGKKKCSVVSAPTW
jgi:hypothetical protein